MADKLVEELKKLVHEKKVVAVIGTGVSVSATKRNPIASWPGLLLNGLERCKDVTGMKPERYQRIKGLIEDEDTPMLISAAQLIKRTLLEYGLGEYTSWLRETVGALEPENKGLIDAIKKLDIPILTTNYDHLLTKVTGLEPVSWRQKTKVERLLRGELNAVLHLHGSWDDHESVILDQTDYDKVVHHEFVQMIEQTYRSTHSFLFIGCGEAGLCDPHFENFRAWSKRVFHESENRHFRLVRSSEVETARQLHGGTERIFPISYGDDFPLLEMFLLSLKGESNAPGISIIQTVSDTDIAPSKAVEGKVVVQIARPVSDSVIINSDVVDQGTELLSVYRDILSTPAHRMSESDLAEQNKIANLLMELLHSHQLEKITDSDRLRKMYAKDELFNRILFGQPTPGALAARKLMAADRLGIQAVREDSDKFQWWDRSVIVSALSLSLMIGYDEEKVNLLIDFVNDRESWVWKKALVGISLGLVGKESHYEDNERLIQKLVNLQTQPDVQFALYQIGYNLEVEKWENLEKRIGVMGMDFEETMEFFEKPQHWFFPFYPENPVLKEKKLPKEIKLYLEESVWIRLPIFKYAICFQFEYFTKEQKEALSRLQKEERPHMIKIYKEWLHRYQPNKDPLLAAQAYDEVFNAMMEIFFFRRYFPQERFKILAADKLTFYTSQYAQHIATKETRDQVEVEKWNSMGNTFSDSGDNEAAINCYTKAIEIRPDYADAWYNMGIVHEAKVDYEAAITCYTKAIEIKSDYANAWYNMGIVHRAKGDNDAAIDCYKKAIKVEPDDYLAWNNMGVAYKAKGDNDTAIDCYKKAVKIHPGDHLVWSNMGVAYKAKGENETAIDCYKKALHLKPEDADYQNSLGFTYLQIGRAQEGVTYLNKALELGSQNHANMNLGHISLIEGNMQAAYKFYKNSLLNYDSPESFWKGMEEDFPYLPQYGITRAQFDTILEQLQQEKE